MAIVDHRERLRHIPSRPGVYRMLGADGTVLYVGKAKDLKRRVGSYFARALNRRLAVMMDLATDIEVTITHTEGEALLLENNLIKAYRPRFNVYLRDDKSYPFIRLTAGDAFPRLAFHRGATGDSDRLFGPYPSASAVRETLQLLQRLFPVRQCRDSFFHHRSRPCLQYQIKRCTAPCVGLIDEATYAIDVEHSVKFLTGRTDEVVSDLQGRMERAAEALDFEHAARLRDQIAALRRVVDRQYVEGGGGDTDIIVCAQAAGSACVQVFFVRAGRSLGNKTFFPSVPEDIDSGEILSGFIAQFYDDKAVPPEIIVGTALEDRELLEEALGERIGRRVVIKDRVREARARWLEMARGNAELALRARLGSRAGYAKRLDALRVALDLGETPQRMECFDISHTGGEQTLASCVVFDDEGPRKSDYRRFNIEDVKPGDDYAAMQQVLRRRYTRIKDGEYPYPDLVCIDGGPGQLTAVEEALEELAIADVTLIGVSKGPDRRPGDEQIWLPNRARPIRLAPDSPALHIIQQMRDEAHRFAITGHRQRRGKARTTSVLEEIPGIGPKRRRLLLGRFGGLQGLTRAGIDDIASIEGISRQLAERIYEAFHAGETS